MRCGIDRVLVAFLVVISYCASMSHGLRAGGGQPNIVFILADDCTFRDIGCYGGQGLTPHIDQLAKQGMLFRSCFQSAPMCSPTRHNLYTGIYPVKTGAYPNHTFAYDGTHSIAHYLKPLGYRVALSGKRHIAPKSVFPFEYLAGAKNPNFTRVEEFLDSCLKVNRPFCLFLCSNEPHDPWTLGDVSKYDAATLKLPPNFIDTEVTRREYVKYLAEVGYFDSQVGKAMALLSKKGLEGNTLVIVASEQGSIFPFAKWTCYDSGLQSAMIVRWPSQVEAGAKSDALVEYTDVVPTLIEVAGGTSPEELDGKSFLPVLRGKAKEHKDYVFGEMTTRGIKHGSTHFGIRCVRSKKFKYIINFTPEVEFQNVCTHKDFFQSWVKKAESDSKAARLVKRYRWRPAVELYDVLNDPFEMINLAGGADYQEVEKQLRAELLAWMQACGDQAQQTELKAKQRQVKTGRR